MIVITGLWYFLKREIKRKTIKTSLWYSRAFLVYYILMHIYLFGVIDIALARGWTNTETGTDWEVWAMWFQWIFSVQFVTGFAAYCLDPRCHANPAPKVLSLLCPIMGNELHTCCIVLHIAACCSNFVHIAASLCMLLCIASCCCLLLHIAEYCSMLLGIVVY